MAIIRLDSNQVMQLGGARGKAASNVRMIGFKWGVSCNASQRAEVPPISTSGGNVASTTDGQMVDQHAGSRG